MKKPTTCHDRGRRPGVAALFSRSSGRMNNLQHRWPALAIVIVLFTALALFAMQTAGAQERTVKADGIVTEITEESATIDNRGYIVSPSTRVFNMDGKRIKIENLKLPVKVKFEYVYTEQGPVIQSMRAVGV